MSATTDPLPSWNDGPTRATILDYVARVTAEGNDDYLQPSDRIAVFDNDGTLWTEKPAYAQAMYVNHVVKEQAALDPDLAADPVVQALLRGDLHEAASHGLPALFGVILKTQSGQTAEEFTAQARAWFADFVHPVTGGPIASTVFQPMLELLAWLRAAEFQIFIVSGGGVEFVRAISADLYGVPPSNVVGSSLEVVFERRGDEIVLRRTPKVIGGVDEGEPKAVNIQAHIGQRPVIAVGNSAGDTEMLEYATSGSLPSLGIVIKHDDAEREAAYAGGAATNPKAIPIEDIAEAKGWTVASIKDDWNRVFPD
jgi:phosphoserine phosphatase